MADNIDGVHAWCSWCGAFCEMKVLEKHWVSRHLYKCSKCYRFVMRCMNLRCDGMAKYHSSADADKLCGSCQGVIVWGEGEVAPVKGHCSWCFEKTGHILQQKNLVCRNSFMCQSCKRSTTKCRFCNDFARSGADGADQTCMLCSKMIPSWDDPKANRESLMIRKKWCSWCVSRTDHRNLATFTVARRATYECVDCTGRTLECSACSIAMARGGAVWDDQFCCLCPRSLKWTENSWSELETKKNAIFVQRTKERVLGELTRDTKEKRQAIERGMIRPFMLMVAMPPVFRAQIASSLGWSLFTEDYFGDPHKEAWQIISKSGSGMLPRSTKAHERVNLLASYCNWWEILERSLQTSYHDPNCIPQVSGAEISKECSGKTTDDRVQDLEEIWLEHMIESLQRNMTTEERQTFDKMMATEDAQAVGQKAQDVAGIDRERVALYSYSLLARVGGMPGKLQLSIMSLQAMATYVPETAATVLPVAGGLALLSTPLFYIGLANLVMSTVDLTIGASIDRLCSPIAVILTQRLLLAMEGISISNYYGVSEDVPEGKTESNKPAAAGNTLSKNPSAGGIVTEEKETIADGAQNAPVSALIAEANPPTQVLDEERVN